VAPGGVLDHAQSALGRTGFVLLHHPVGAPAGASAGARRGRGGADTFTAPRRRPHAAPASSCTGAGGFAHDVRTTPSGVTLKRRDRRGAAW
jgi:hypothetical protein